MIASIEIKIQQRSSHIDVDAMKKRIEENPKDLVRSRLPSLSNHPKEALYELGVYYSQQGKTEDAYDQMFKIISVDRNWNNQAAKEFLLKVYPPHHLVDCVQSFGSLGDDEIAIKGRRRLNNLWFS